MIYLIDDKIDRQNDFGWNSNNNSLFKDILVSISEYSQIEKKEERELIFSDGNLILFHESFFDTIKNKHLKDSNEIRNDLNKFAVSNKNFKVVYFSGSYNSRELNINGGSIPVSVLYQNLAMFLQQYKTNGFADLKYLFFGKTPEVENELLKKQEKSNSSLIQQLSEGLIVTKNDNLLITGNSQGFPIPFKKSINFTFFNKNINDSRMSSKIDEWFFEKEYDNIFIPLCFGPILSDFNGLRLALHIRCTSSINSLKPIYLYSFLDDISMLWSNEYFDVLKTKNIKVINYDKAFFQKVAEEKLNNLSKLELSKEMNRINLKTPNNFFDNHSIANIWGMYRLLEMEGINPKKITSLANDKFLNNIYIKLLLAKNPIKEKIIEESKKDTKRFASKIKGPKILGKIDLNKFKK